MQLCGEVFCNKRSLVDRHQKMSQPQKILSRSNQQMPQISQTFLRRSNSDFVKKITKAFLSAEFSFYKLNNKHVKNLFSDISQNLIAKTTCRKTVVKLGTDELQRIRNVLDNKHIFLVVDESTLSRTQYLNILVETLDMPHISWLSTLAMLTK